MDPHRSRCTASVIASVASSISNTGVAAALSVQYLWSQPATASLAHMVIVGASLVSVHSGRFTRQLRPAPSRRQRWVGQYPGLRSAKHAVPLPCYRRRRWVIRQGVIEHFHHRLWRNYLFLTATWD